MIEVIRLSKQFGPKLAVDNISFSVAKGEVLGFLGPNGAGKSTTMRMITGFIPPTRGTVTVGGHDIQKSPIQLRFPTDEFYQAGFIERPDKTQPDNVRSRESKPIDRALDAHGPAVEHVCIDHGRAHVFVAE